MELNWSTFLLEILNFLVLVWILKRFLYKPVLDIVERRRLGIQNQLAEAQLVQQQADSLKAQYENRVAEWDEERQKLRDVLAQELDAERGRQMESLKASLAEEREKAQVAESRRRAEADRNIQHQALQQSAQFATRLLEKAAGPELEARFVELLLDSLAGLSGDQIAAIGTQFGESPPAIQVTSAYPLPEGHMRRLEESISEITGRGIPVTYGQDATLLAGLRITIGAWVLHANLRDELKSFADFAHAAR